MKQRLQSTLMLLDCALRAIIAVWTVKATTVVWSRRFRTLSLSFHNHLFDDEKPTLGYIVSKYSLKNNVLQQDIIADAENLTELNDKLTQIKESETNP